MSLFADRVFSPITPITPIVQEKVSIQPPSPQKSFRSEAAASKIPPSYGRGFPQQKFKQIISKYLVGHEDEIQNECINQGFDGTNLLSQYGLKPKDVQLNDTLLSINNEKAQRFNEMRSLRSKRYRDHVKQRGQAEPAPALSELEMQLLHMTKEQLQGELQKCEPQISKYALNKKKSDLIARLMKYRNCAPMTVMNELNQ